MQSGFLHCIRCHRGPPPILYGRYNFRTMGRGKNLVLYAHAWHGYYTVSCLVGTSPLRANALTKGIAGAYIIIAAALSTDSSVGITWAGDTTGETDVARVAFARPIAVTSIYACPVATVRARH